MMKPEGVRPAARVAAPAFAAVAAAAVVSGACAARAGGDDAYAELAEHAGREVVSVDFTDTGPFAADTLEEVVETRPTECSLLGLPFCIPGTSIGREVRTLDPDAVVRDARRLEVFYGREGFYGTSAQPSVDEVDGAVAVTFALDVTEPVMLDSLRVEGTEDVLDPDSLARTLPLQPGDRFERDELAASADTILRALRVRGYAYAEVLRSYDVDRRPRRATAVLRAVAGPQVTVDSIVVSGAANLGRSGALRQLTFDAGDLLRAEDLLDSQRNLYALELVRVATVSIAPDTLQVAPSDSTQATVLVGIAEAPVHVVDAAVGFGTVECLRGQAEWVSRSFGPGARRLGLTGSVSKLGVGTGGWCNAFEGDAFGTSLDYRFTAELTEPAFLNPRNRLTASLFALRQSEPGVFQREARGGRLGLLHRVRVQEFLSGAVEAERRRTRATPALFCIALRVCRTDEVVGRLEEPRWRNALEASWVRDRTVTPLSPDSGYVVRTNVTWATPLLASDIDFVRWTGEGARFQTVRPQWVLATWLRLGSFFGTASVDPRLDDFLPPEERFFTGGANSVRGFGRNELGPGVYVSRQPAPSMGEDAPLPPPDSIDFFPLGGTAVAVTSVEIRMPAPFARDRLRAAVFVDAGAVGRDGFGDLDDWRVTPGVGVRIASPVGPIRIDLAYNPYGLEPGPLFAADPETGDLIRIADRYERDPGGFLNRLQLHLAIGEVF